MTTSGDLFRSRDLQQIIPERIKEAREARGYTREAFAEALAITPQAVGQYEVGQHAPGPEVMSKIIGLTGQPPAFFTADRPAVRERFGMPFWRSLARMRRADRLKVARRLEWSADVVAYIERFIELPPTQLPSIKMPADFSDFEALELAAESIRDAWQLGSLPIEHMAATLESNGIVLIKETVHCEDKRCRTAMTVPKSEISDGNNRKEDAMETMAHLLLILGYGLLVLRHLLGL
jgi:transcriptional regulator with XRE-family HTH domain